jgi:hypothetical protein
MPWELTIVPHAVDWGATAADVGEAGAARDAPERSSS